MRQHISIRHMLTALACAAAVCSGSIAYAHGGDIGIAVEDGRIVTGMVDENDEFHQGVRVFASEITERTIGSITIYDTIDPGFDGEPGTFSVPGSLGLSFGDALKVWNGAGFSATAGETMTVSLVHGSPMKLDTATTSTGPAPGFDVEVSPDGSWHRHLTFRLNGSNGAAPAAGIYLLQLGLTASDASVAPSTPFWIVFGFNGAEEDHEAAIHWTEANMVPELSGILALTGAIAGLAGYRLKRRR